MYDRIGLWTYGHRTHQGTRQLTFSKAREGAGMANPLRVTRVSADHAGKPAPGKDGSSIHDHKNCLVKEAAVDWLQNQHAALISTGWQLMHVEGEAETISLDREAAVAE